MGRILRRPLCGGDRKATGGSPGGEGRGLQGRRLPGFAQIEDHLTHNSPFVPFFGEVVCTLGGTSLMRVTRAGDAPIRRSSCHHDPQTTQTSGSTGYESATPVPNGGQVHS